VLLDAPGGTYWKNLDAFIKSELLSARLISPEDVHLYKVTESIDESVAEVLNFFSVYHSMRFVRNQLVLRLKKKPSDELLDGINATFTDICTEGGFELRGPLPAEREEDDLVDLPRLVFRFNRRSQGRLRLVIDSLNKGSIVTG
jgi:hypothetical protein